MSKTKNSIFTPDEIVKILESLDNGELQNLVLLAQGLRNAKHPRKNIYEGVEKFLAKKNHKKA